MNLRWQSLKWLLLCDVCLIGYSGLLTLRDNSIPAASMFAAALGALVWQFALVLRNRQSTPPFEVEPHIKRTHYFQALVQVCLYSYWGLYWDAVSAWIPLIVAQLLFAYALEALLAWSQRRAWRLGFGPLPIVMSINLFLWFHEEVFYFQFLLVAVVFLVKDFITWQRDGRKTHIFNPSGFALSVAAIALMLTDTVPITEGVDLTRSFYLPPNLFELMFLLGLILQFSFSITLVTFGAMLSITAIFFVLKFIYSVPITPTPVDVVVFLGVNFIVTDPATSPKSAVGKFLFGMTYGVGVFVAYAILRSIQQPSYFDKILPVPIVNLLVKRFDVLGNYIYLLAARRLQSIDLLGNRYVHLVLYVALFAAILPLLKFGDRNSIDPFPRPAFQPSPRMMELEARAVAFRLARKSVYKPFGFAAEAIYFDDLRSLERDTAESHILIGVASQGLGMRDQAIEHYRRALSLDPENVTAQKALRSILEPDEPPD